MSGILSGADASETIEAFIMRCIEQSGAAPTIELAEFSGEDADWKKDGDAVYMRLTASRLRDEAGNSYEIHARLFAPGNLWHIPRERTEMVVLVAPHLGGVPAAGWCMWGAQKPPEKLDRGKAFLAFDDATKFLVKCGGWALRAALGKTILGIDKDTGEFAITLGGRSYLKFHPTGGAEGLPMFEIAIVDSNSKLRTLFKLSANGLEFLTANAAGTTKQTWAAKPDGTFTTFGTGKATLGWTSGMLGASVAGGNIMYVGPVASTSWSVAV
jgi:hypothetical protein